MNTLSRRNLLRTTSAIVPAAIVAACGTTTTTTPTPAPSTPQTVTQQVVTYVQGIATSVENAATGLAKLIPSVTAAQVTQFGTYASTIAGLAGQITTNILSNVALPIAQQIGSDISQALNFAQSVSLPTTVENVLTAAQIVLPIILALLSGLPLAPSATLRGMTEAQAFATLGLTPPR